MNIKPDYHKTMKVSKYSSYALFGKYLENDDGTLHVTGTIDEFTFYYLYCSINNIVLEKDKQLSPTQLLVMSAFMAKPADFCLPSDGKDGKLMELAKEISEDDKERTRNSIYQSVKRLKEAGYLVETEDKLIEPNARLQYVRQVVKKQIKEQGVASFDYIFKCLIK